MRACLALFVATALVGTALADCTACISGQCYRKQATGERGLYMDIDRNKNILYCESKLCELDTGRCHAMTFTEVMWGLAVDQRTGDTYGAFEQGAAYCIYKLDPANNDDKLLVPNGVMKIHFKDKLYYTPFGRNGIFTYEDGESRIVAGTGEYFVHSFIVDKNDDIYFESDWIGNHFIKRLSKGVVYQTVHWDGGYFMTVDVNGNAVFIHKESHAVYRATDGQLTEIGVINDTIHDHSTYNRPLFDRDNNIIYSNKDKTFDILYLKRDTGINCTYSISQNKAIITEIYRSLATDITPTYNIDTVTSNSPGRDTEDNDDISASTPAPESTASTPEEDTENNDDLSPSTPTPESTASTPKAETKDNDGMSPSAPAPDGSSAARGQQAHTGREQQSSCRCEGPRIPTITIKVEFN